VIEHPRISGCNIAARNALLAKRSAPFITTP